MRVLAPRQDLPAIFSGGPLVLADALLPDPAALAVAGLVACRVEPGAGSAVLRLSPPAADEELVTLEHPPVGVLAVIGREAPPLRPLVAWCAAAGGEPPTLVLAEGALAALPALLELALAEAARQARQAASRELLLAELRAEAQALRESAAARAASRPAAPAAAPSARLLDPPDPSRPPLRLGAASLTLGIPTGGVAAVALHLPGPAGAGLSVALTAAESGRVLAAWRVPAAAMPGGWLRLDLPAPEAGRGETLALSLAALPPGEVLVSAAASGGPALAIGTAQPGLRPMPAAFLAEPPRPEPPEAAPLPPRPPEMAAALPAPAAPVALPEPSAGPAPALPEAAAPLPEPSGKALPPAAALPPPAPLLAPPPPEAAPRRVTLDGRQQGDGWELLDLRVTGLAFGAETWREIKVKFGLSGEDVTLEFRRAPGWPACFDTWPGGETDAHGEKFVIVLGEERLWGLDRIAPGRDRALVTALAAAMPGLVAEVLEGADPGRFAEAAARLALRLGPEEQG
jgi:hypothetical protein